VHGPLRLFPGRPVEPGEIVSATRVGIKLAADEIARFYIRGNPFVSRA
jgi:3-methyladenine DNA glycosylase Mpg